MMKKRRGQSTVEYTTLVVILIGALVAMGGYVKRGISGRWKAAIEDMGGDQYDPRLTNGTITTTLDAETQTRVTAVNAEDGGGYWTMRVDLTNSIETKTGSMTVGAY